MTACCYFGADLRNQIDYNFPSRVKDGTPHSSSDLFYFTLLLPFTWTNYSKSNFLFLFYSLGQKYSKSNSSSLFSSDKIIPSQNSLFSLLFLDKKFLSLTPNPQKHSKSHFPSDLEKFPLFAYLFYFLAAGV